MASSQQGMSLNSNDAAANGKTQITTAMVTPAETCGPRAENNREPENVAAHGSVDDLGTGSCMANQGGG